MNDSDQPEADLALLTAALQRLLTLAVRARMAAMCPKRKHVIETKAGTAAVAVLRSGAFHARKRSFNVDAESTRGHSPTHGVDVLILGALVVNLQVCERVSPRTSTRDRHRFS